MQLWMFGMVNEWSKKWMKEWKNKKENKWRTVLYNELNWTQFWKSEVLKKNIWNPFDWKEEKKEKERKTYYNTFLSTLERDNLPKAANTPTKQSETILKNIIFWKSIIIFLIHHPFITIISCHHHFLIHHHHHHHLRYQRKSKYAKQCVFWTTMKPKESFHFLRFPSLLLLPLLLQKNHQFLKEKKKKKKWQKKCKWRWKKRWNLEILFFLSHKTRKRNWIFLIKK